MPDTWRYFAPLAGLSPNAPMTPANQEKVAKAMSNYYSLKYGGDERLIAAAWYGGEGVANSLQSNKMSNFAFYRPQYSGGHAYPSIASYINQATGSEWRLGEGKGSSTNHTTVNITNNIHGSDATEIAGKATKKMETSLQRLSPGTLAPVAN
jgi:hypothetical protein